MAGEPARTLPTRRLPDQITSSSAIPDEDDSRRAMAVTAAVTAAVAAAIPAAIDMVFSRGLHVAYYLSLGSHASRLLVDKILLSLDTCLWKGNQVL